MKENEILGIKSKGFFKRKTFTHFDDFGKEHNKIMYVKSGKWIYYNENGSVKEKIKY